MNNSSVTSGTFTIQTIPVSAPVFTPAGGTFNDVQTVTISSATSGATIRYTTDGSTPTASTGTVYSSPISVTTGMTIKAIAYKSGLIDSSVSSSVYILKCADPIFTPAAGGFDRPTTVTITSATPGATIRYTTNGTEPTVSSGTIYSSAIPVNVSMTIKAIAYKTNFTNSDVVSGTYSLGSEDGDNDGVIDVEDDYPQDATRALNNFFPSTGSGTVAFEDLWPSQGDFDLNDVVVDFSFKTITNASNKLVETYATFVLRATGAALRNGFGFQLASNSIPASAITVTGMNLTKDYITLGSNGTEEGQSKPTFIVFDNAFDLLANPGTGSGINVTIGAPYVEPATITLHIVYTPNTYDAELLDIEHFNPFIIVNMVRGREVHLPDYAPTSLQDMTMFGTFDDNSIPVINRYYKTSTNLPWGFMTLESFAYPAEKTPIMDCYIHFAEWAQSSGQKYPDWYKDLPGYRNAEKLYHK
jgi:LruC domain-containing protein